jgi:hypothetical protein
VSKTRTLTVKIHDATIEKGWSNSKLSLIEYGDQGSIKKAVIKIESPSDLSYIRERLNEIEDYWKGQLGVKS